MPNNGQINCDCAFWSPLILGTIIGVGVTDPAAVDISSVLRRSDAASTPNRSVVVRLIARIDTGRSMVPRRHAVSHGAPHTRPQMDANGFGPLAIRYARA